MQTININETVHILSIKSLISINTDHTIYLNSFNNKFRLKSIEDLDRIIKNLKECEFRGLELVFSNEIDVNKKEINIWVTPIVKSA